MPYITPTARRQIADGGRVMTPGELNYIITTKLVESVPPTLDLMRLVISQEIDLYVQQHGLSYDTINGVIGALECARREFKRRKGFDLEFLSDIADGFYGTIAGPYEDKKIQLNGDVY